MSVGERERVAVREQGHTEGTAREETSGPAAAGPQRAIARARRRPREVGARIAQFCARRTVDGLALGQVLVVRAGQYAGARAAEEALQVAVVDVAKEHSFVRGVGEREKRGTWRCCVPGNTAAGTAKEADATGSSRDDQSISSPSAKSDAWRLRAKRQRGATAMRILAIGDSLTAGYCLPPPFKPWAPVLSKLLPGKPTRRPHRLLRLDDVAARRRGRQRERRRRVRRRVAGRPPQAQICSVRRRNHHGRHQRPRVRRERQGHRRQPRAASPNVLGRRRRRKRCSCRFRRARDPATRRTARPTTRCARGRTRKASKVLFVDSSSLVPFARPSPLWMMDGLHMTAEGYEQFGTRLADAIAGFVAPGSGS